MTISSKFASAVVLSTIGVTGLFAGAASADALKTSCSMAQACKANGRCKPAAEPVVIGFCDTADNILVAAQGGKVTKLRRIMAEEAYEKLPYRAFRGKPLDVGQWTDPDVAKGAPNLITFIMLENATTAMMFRGDPLKQRRLGYLAGTCSTKRVQTCRANK